MRRTSDIPPGLRRGRAASPVDIGRVRILTGYLLPFPPFFVSGCFPPALATGRASIELNRARTLINHSGYGVVISEHLPC